VSKQAYNAEMIICSQSSKLSSMGICSYIHFIKALKSKEKLLIHFVVPFVLNLFGWWVRRLKVNKHIIYSIYCLAARPARSQMVLPSKRGHVSHYISHLMDGDFSNPGYLQGILSSNWATHQLSIYSAILTSSTRRMLLSTWKFVQ
jgi:hypothetical protein